jgi:phosphatidylglycerol:prolipoprotein diacylglycerol transferase
MPQVNERRLLLRIIMWGLLWWCLFLFFAYRNYGLGLTHFSVRFAGRLITPFGIQVLLGIVFGIDLVHLWAIRFKQDWQTLKQGLWSIAFIGLGLGHVFNAATYHPDRFWEAVLNPFDGLSSFGGLLFGSLTAIVFLRIKKLPFRPTIDAITFGFVGVWLFGRLACFSVHDHLGVPTDFWLGLPLKGAGVLAMRHEVSLYELFFTWGILLSLGGMAWRRPRYPGFCVALAALTYAPVRLGIDFLRESEPLYAGLNPAQWSCIVLLGVGLMHLPK